MVDDGRPPIDREDANERTHGLPPRQGPDARLEHPPPGRQLLPERPLGVIAVTDARGGMATAGAASAGTSPLPGVAHAWPSTHRPPTAWAPTLGPFPPLGSLGPLPKLGSWPAGLGGPTGEPGGGGSSFGGNPVGGGGCDDGGIRGGGVGGGGVGDVGAGASGGGRLVSPGRGSRGDGTPAVRLGVSRRFAFGVSGGSSYSGSGGSTSAMAMVGGGGSYSDAMEVNISRPQGVAAVTSAASSGAIPPMRGGLPSLGVYRPRVGPDTEGGGDGGAATWGPSRPSGGRGGVAATGGGAGGMGVYSGLREPRLLCDDAMEPHELPGGGRGGGPLASTSSGMTLSRKGLSGGGGGGWGVVAAGGGGGGGGVDAGCDGAGGGSGGVGGWGGDGADGGAPRGGISPILSERERKDYQRKLRNRETARVSNEKRKAKFLTLQADVEMLRPKAAAAAALREEVLPLRAEVAALRGVVATLRAENARLVAENEGYRSQQHGYR